MRNIARIIGGNKEQRGEALKKAIQSLPPIQQKILVLRYEEKLSVKEITTKTKCSATTVYKKLNSALYKLRKEINPHYYQQAFSVLNREEINDVS